MGVSFIGSMRSVIFNSVAMDFNSSLISSLVSSDECFVYIYRERDCEQDILSKHLFVVFLTNIYMYIYIYKHSYTM